MSPTPQPSHGAFFACRRSSALRAVVLRAVVLCGVAMWGLLGLSGAQSLLRAQTLWSDDAENGALHVVDHTDASYRLIQSDLTAEGEFAFHLAHPTDVQNWFELVPSIAIQADTKLFFHSRLGYASPDQVARVQLSTNGGATWPVELYAQPGTNGAGEGSFRLQEVDLSDYANQEVRFRFLYDFSSGGYYPQTSSGVGWYVDDIQIGDQLVKNLYSIGDPTPFEQQYLEYVNRSRADALAESMRLASEADPDVRSTLSFFGVNVADIESQFAWYVDQGHIPLHAPPLSFNEKLLHAARLHTEDMFRNVFQDHTSSANPPSPFPPYAALGQRLDAVGYRNAAGENIFSFADSVAQGHAGFDVDWGNVTNSGPAFNPEFAGQGMQNQAGHRINLHAADFTEVGIGVINGTNTSGGRSVGPQLVTQNFGGAAATFVTGVVYEDLNGNAFYDIGEGRGGVRVDVDGSGFYAISSESGGYSVPVAGDGEFSVEFTGGGFDLFATTALVVGGASVKVDYLVAAGPAHASDFGSDGEVDERDQVVWQVALGQTAAADADADADSNGSDFLYWQEEFGAGLDQIAVAVPEPAALGLAVFATIMALRRRR